MRREPALLYVCSQHGNEPAGREACLSLLRDLALTNDPSLVDMLEHATVLFVPSANPDGRAANTRGNSRGTDINRDHLNLVTEEARAVARVVRDYKPEMVLDLHEYGPSQPVLYDDDVLLLWPRNLNADAAIHDEAVGLAERLGAAVEAEGYSWDEYGQQKVGDYHVAQTAGDGDEGIARNAMGLRHSLGILAETRVDADPTNSLTEAIDEAEVNRRRVLSHTILAYEALRYLDDSGAAASQITKAAAAAKAREGADARPARLLRRRRQRRARAGGRRLPAAVRLLPHRGRSTPRSATRSRCWASRRASQATAAPSSGWPRPPSRSSRCCSTVAGRAGRSRARRSTAARRAARLRSAP